MPPDSAFRLPESPIAAIGTATLLLAFVVNAYALAAGLAGQQKNSRRLVASAVYASWAFTALMCLASSLIVYAFLSHDYTIKYVAHYSDTSMPLFYKLTAYWGGLDGSLMFWVWVMSMFSAVAVFINRHRHRDIIGYVVATVAAVATFFLGLLLWAKNPFTTFLSAPPVDGQGLNPLLQTYWMVIHPPALYTGFVSMTVPFAFCMAALASGRLDDAWLYSVRAWVMISWFFLSLGLVLGGIWAYEELGWGGYWAWDPVENAGLLPWFTCTAFLHSVVIQERRGMLKVWNVVLMVTSFFLTIFGTFLTRSGVVQSVHAFGQDNQLAMMFILFMMVILVVSIGLILYRLPALRSGAQLESFWSREFAFLVNNWLLLIACFFVLFMTMLPTLSEAVTGVRSTAAAPAFNKLMVPIGLLLLFMSGVAPLLAWRRTTTRRLLEQFLFPGAALSLTAGLIATLLPRWRVRTTFLSEKIELPVALVCMALVAFVIATVLQEFWRGARARAKQTGGDPVTSLIGVVLAKKRKYGGYVVHLGVALMFLGFAGKARSIDKQVAVDKAGDTFKLRDLTFRYDQVGSHDNDNHTEVWAKVTVLDAEQETVATLYPAERFYKKGNQERTNEVAIDRNLDQDIYLVLNQADPKSQQAQFTVYLNPLVNWVWLGFGMLFFGTVICLIPESVVTQLKPRRKTAVGRATEAVLMLLTLGAVTLGLVKLAGAQTPPTVGPGARGAPAEGAKPPPVHDDDQPPATTSMHVELQGQTVDPDTAPDTARKLYHDLVCLCGGCPRETLAQCKCGYAARERETILKMVEEGQGYDAIVAAYTKRYGGEHVLANPRSPFAWVVPVAAFGGALALVIGLGGRWIKRSRRKPIEKPKEPSGDAKQREALEDKLDDELDDLE